MEAQIKLHTRSRSKHLALGRVHGFDRDEAECQGYEGSVVLRGLLASECDAFEALEFADGLLDACPRLLEYFRKECRSIDRVDLYGMTGQMPRLHHRDWLWHRIPWESPSSYIWLNPSTPPKLKDIRLPQIDMRTVLTGNTQQTPHHG